MELTRIAKSILTHYMRDLKDDQVCRAFYEFLKTRDISKVHLSRDRPMTGLRADMIGLNLNPYDAFLKKAVENNGMHDLRSWIYTKV